MTYVTKANRMLIGGELVGSVGGGLDASINPANEEVIGEVPAADARDVERAVVAAEKAWPAWFERTPAERGETMRRFASAITERADEILRVEVADTGNTITPMRHDVKITVGALNYFAGLAHELKGETIPGAANALHMTVHEPYGVVARITPFNHPLMFSVARTAAALASGNAVIIKPPETSPLSAMLLAEIARETLPAGVFNIVTGDGRTVGDAIVRHPRIKRIAFIGSVATGRAIQRAAAEVGVKHVTLELGGKNPLVAFGDADPERVARAAVAGMNFGWQGQSCGSTSRLIVHRDIHAAVLNRVTEMVAAIRLGDPMLPETGMGPMNSKTQLERTMGFIAGAEADGARLVTGGRRPQAEEFERGFWVEPTVYADVKPASRLWREEVFGPVLSIASFETADEAMALANDTDLGLAAAIFTGDLNQALRAARRIRAGYVWINGAGPHYTGVPFGGMKSSGVGREESIEEMFSYVESKSINVML